MTGWEGFPSCKNFLLKARWMAVNAAWLDVGQSSPWAGTRAYFKKNYGWYGLILFLIVNFWKIND